MVTLKEAERLLNELNGDLELLKKNDERDKTVIKTSMIGILANVFLAAFKAVVGLMSNSIAIVLDAVNNLSDAGASLITIVGTKLSRKDPDRKHPFGYGRIEYLSAMIIALIIFYAGITSFVESVKSIFNPAAPDYSRTTLIIVAVGVVVKIFLGRYVKEVGEKIKSDSLIESGEEARLDAVISISTLVAAGLYIWKGISLEAWLGAIISIVIIKAGIEMLQDTLSKVLGERADSKLIKDIKNTVMAFPEVRGAYDLVLNNYGPDNFNGSIHIEIPDTCTADQIDDLVRSITIEVYKKHHVILTAIGVYSINTKDDKAVRMREQIKEKVLANEHVLQMHGFYVNEEKKTIRFDVVISFDAPDRSKTYKEIFQQVSALYPDYVLYLAMDSDFSES